MPGRVFRWACPHVHTSQGPHLQIATLSSRVIASRSALKAVTLPFTSPSLGRRKALRTVGSAWQHAGVETCPSPFSSPTLPQRCESHFKFFHTVVVHSPLHSPVLSPMVVTQAATRLEAQKCEARRPDVLYGCHHGTAHAHLGSVGSYVCACGGTGGRFTV